MSPPSRHNRSACDRTERGCPIQAPLGWESTIHKSGTVIPTERSERRNLPFRDRGGSPDHIVPGGNRRGIAQNRARRMPKGLALEAWEINEAHPFAYFFTAGPGVSIRGSISARVAAL